MRTHLPIFLGEIVWFGFGGMLNAWLPVSPGWIWAGVTIIGTAGLLLYYRSSLTHFYSSRMKRKKHYTGDANPVHFHVAVSEPTVTVTQPTFWARTKRCIRRRLGAGSTRPTPVRRIAKIERCHQELVRYICSQQPDPIGFEHNALWVAFQPHIETVCHILDEQEIPHPEIDADIILVGTGKWGTFLAKVLAVKHDVEKARLVYGEMRGGPDSGGELDE